MTFSIVLCVKQQAATRLHRCNSPRNPGCAAICTYCRKSIQGERCIFRASGGEHHPSSRTMSHCATREPGSNPAVEIGIERSSALLTQLGADLPVRGTLDEKVDDGLP